MQGTSGERWNTATSGSTPVLHYFLNGQLIATRRAGTLFFIHGDHLGSVSLTTRDDGSVVAGTDIRRFPYGTVRSGSEYVLLAEHSFTGQLSVRPSRFAQQSVRAERKGSQHRA